MSNRNELLQGILTAVSGGGGFDTADGIADYNDSSTATTPINIVADTWTDVPNDGAGSFTNLDYLPTGVTELMDTSNGHLKLNELSLGDNCLIRNDFTINPNTNNSLLEKRYVLGDEANGNEYYLGTTLGRLDSGSGKDYRFAIQPDMIYMGDTNTKNHPVKFQIKLSTSGTLVNAGTAIGVVKR